MRSIKTRYLLAAGALAALIGGGAIAARYAHPSIEDRADFATYMITKKLDLRDDQQSKLDKLADEWIASASGMKEFRNSVFAKVREMAGSDHISEEKVKELRQMIKAEFDKRADKLIPQLVVFYNGLDKEQKNKVVARLDKAAERMTQGGHRRGWGHWRERHHGWDD